MSDNKVYGEMAEGHFHKIEVQVQEVGSGWKVKVFDRRHTSYATYELGVFKRLNVAERNVEKEFKDSYQKPVLNILPVTKAGFRELDRRTGRRK